MSEDQKWLTFELVNCSLTPEEVRDYYRELQHREDNLAVKDEGVKAAMQAAGFDVDELNKAILGAEALVSATSKVK